MSSPLSSLLFLLFALFLTLIFEIPYLAIWGKAFCNKNFLKTAIFVNVISNLTLNLLLKGFASLLSPLTYFLLFVGLEIFVVLFEFWIYQKIIKNCKVFLFLLTLSANLLSLFFGSLILFFLF